MPEVIVSDETRVQPKTTYLKDYQVPRYLTDTVDLNFDLHDDHALVTSRMHVYRNVKSDDLSSELILNGEELKLESIKLNGVALTSNDYILSAGALTVKNMPDSADIEIVTRIFPQKNTELQGLYRSANTYCTQCEAEGFRRITYYMDHPDVLATFTTTITANAKTHPVLLSNGNMIDAGKSENGRHWATWQDPFKKPCYLFALVAGDFDLTQDNYVTQSGRKIDLRIYVDKGFGDQTRHAMYSVKQAMRWDESAYGREYDLDTYMIVAISDFTMGAMENKGLNIFNTKYVLARPDTATDDDNIHILSVIGHEYFHNWTGNRVTCRDWFQLSLKEGLTIFRDQSFSEEVLSSAVMRIKDVVDLRERQFTEDAGPLAHPVRPESYIEINNFYTDTIYNKGAELLRMLKTLLGKETFRHAMDLYFERHDGQAVTIEDYVKVMEDASGLDLTQFRRWYSQAGTPVVTVKDDYDPANKRYTLTLTQITPPTPGQPDKLPLHIPVQMGLISKNGEEMLHQLIELKTASQTFTFDNIDSRPIPSLFRHFSAPIKLQYPYTDDDLILLIEHDHDAFNRWDAMQTYLLRLIKAQIQHYQQGKECQVPDECIALFSHLLTEKMDDQFLQAEMLLLPSEKMIGDQMQVVDVDAIHAVREHLLATIAAKLDKQWLALYQQLNEGKPDSEFNIRKIGARQLKNRCLGYLLILSEYIDLGLQQFQRSFKTNMTDTVPALLALSNTDSPQRQQALDAFYQAWKQEPLVIDKWLSIQATSKLPDTLNRVKQLMRHESFDLKNPNKVYALLGAFGNRNAVNFHARNGEGYALLGDVVQSLDKINPQVAGRMVKPLTDWRRYDKERQVLMRIQLEKLAENKLSPDLYELVTKSL